MKKISFILLLSLFLSSCAAFKPPTAPLGGYLAVSWTHYIYNNYTIQIISDPPGAAIEWNNDYVGNTPYSLIYNGNMGNGATITVKATPKVPGQYVQYKILRNPLPSKIYFNMNLAPTSNDYNININK
jgi:hypothetical protein